MQNTLNKQIIKSKGKILVIDNEPEISWIFSKILGEYGYEVISSQTGKEGLDKVRKCIPDLVFLDLKLQGVSGIDILKSIKEINPDIQVIIITAHETIQTAVHAMRLGAYDYIPKPIPNDRLKIIVDKVIENQQLSKQVDFLKKGNIALNEIIGQSLPMQKLFKMIKCAAPHDVGVILRGESGTGKELVARAIHTLSNRRDKSFVPLDCATLPDSLVESELFGYERGAFTGADNLKIGKFEMAKDGTVFLDEIANLTTLIQVKLLRVLQERKIERLGGKKPISINVRIITATNRNLEEAIGNGEFREDLYHRLNVFEIILPPLRERGDDILLLSRYFLRKFNKEMDTNVKEFSPEVIEIFNRCQWPGNVRELENTIKSSIILAKDKVLPSHLPFHITRNIKNPPLARSRFADEIKGNNLSGSMESLSPNGNLDIRMVGYHKISLKEARRNIINDTEKYMIERTLNENGWNKKRTAQILEIDYKSLWTKIKKYSITR